MSYECRIEADSINLDGDRLTTFVVTYPRFVHSELMTHRVFSRNSASSRAIPISKMIENVLKDPAGPVYWGKNQKGMVAGDELGDQPLRTAKHLWIKASIEAVKIAKDLDMVGVHKQIVNRILEPWQWMTTIISSTDYQNFFKQRCHPDAQPEIRRIAEMMQSQYRIVRPTETPWHLPFLQEDEESLSLDTKMRVCTARCARVSYLTHDGRRAIDDDMQLHDRLVASGHWSPFEHVAHVDQVRCAPPGGNFRGWRQYRQLVQR